MNKLTKISRAVLAIAMTLMVALPSFAHNFEVGGIYYNYLDKTAKTVEVTYKGSSDSDYYDEYTGSVTIPSSVTYSGTTYSVTSIGSYAFEDCTGLTSISIPNSVTTIGSSAFYECSGLTSITIPNSVTSIGNSAFLDCTGLTSITIPNSVTLIGAFAFTRTAWYNNLADGVIYINNVLYEYKGSMPNGTSISVKDGTVSISGYAFYECSGLTTITIPNSITSIGNMAFKDCSGLTSITIPNSVTSIGSYAFEDCTGLTSITIPNSVTEIGNSAFTGTAWYNNLADGVIYINNVLYEYKGSMPNGTSISVKDGTVSISPYAFSGCSGLTSITIPNSVTSIGNDAFSNCSGLTSITIPNSVTDIGEWAFYGCKGLTSITIPNSVASIGDKTFYGCKGLTSITIPNSVTSIGDGTFYNCSGLTSVTIGNSVTSIGDEAFRSCSGLTSVTIGNSVTSIGGRAFYGCTGLTSVTIPNSVTSIGDEAFNYCWDLDTIISLNPTPPVCANSNSFYNYSSVTLYVPKDSYAKYFIDDVWGQFTNIKKIEILVSSITINNSSIELDKGSTATLSATIAPSNATIKNIVWTSSNPQIATVDQSGKVTALSAGTATITAIANDGSNVSASCQVVVKGVETKITLSQTEANLPVNDIMTLSYEVVPPNNPCRMVNK